MSKNLAPGNLVRSVRSCETIPLFRGGFGTGDNTIVAEVGPTDVCLVLAVVELGHSDGPEALVLSRETFGWNFASNFLVLTNPSPR